MKILFIIDSLGGGGAERSTQVLCDYLHENDVDFKVRLEELYEELELLNINASKLENQISQNIQRILE